MTWNPWFTFLGSWAAGHALHLCASCRQDSGDRAAVFWPWGWDGGVGGWGTEAGAAHVQEDGNIWFPRSPCPWQFCVGPFPSCFSLTNLHFVTDFWGRLLTFVVAELWRDKGSSSSVVGSPQSSQKSAPRWLYPLALGLPRIREPDFCIAPGPNSASRLHGWWPKAHAALEPRLGEPCSLVLGKRLPLALSCAASFQALAAHPPLGITRTTVRGTTSHLPSWPGAIIPTGPLLSARGQEVSE